MKKSLLLLGAGVMLLTSCSNDELVNPVANTGKDLQPIGFNYKVSNMSRAAENMEDYSPAFGVWAYKGTTQADAVGTAATTGDQVVMCNYLVGYTNGTDKGYVPTKGQVNYSPATNYWYYEGLGYADAGYTWASYGDFTAATASKRDKQYLKYWDQATDYHYFYAYAPYSATVTFNQAEIDPEKANNEPYMQFENIEAGKTTLENATGAVTLVPADVNNYMYAAAKVKSSSHALVPLSFRRLLSQIRIGFYESVPGYKVELCGLSEAENAVVFAPTHEDGGTYTKGSYLVKGSPRVYFTQAKDDGTEDEDAPIVAHVNYPTPAADATWDKPIYYPYFWLKDGASHTPEIPHATSSAGARLGELMSVLPADALQPNDGFTLNVTLKFTAEDTNEVFYVYGARVYVPAEAVQWEPNKRYTYIFHITKGVSGTTGTKNPAIGYGTDPSHSLVPIVFEDVTVENFDDAENEVEYEYDVNEGQYTNP